MSISYIGEYKVDYIEFDIYKNYSNYTIYIKKFDEEVLKRLTRKYNDVQEHFYVLLKFENYGDFRVVPLFQTGLGYYFYINVNNNRESIEINDIKEEDADLIFLNQYTYSNFLEYIKKIDEIYKEEVCNMSKENNNTEYNIVEKPEHYFINVKGVDIEVIDIIDSIVEHYPSKQGIRVGNILKYVLRAHKKDGIRDFKKAKKYINMLVDLVEKDEQE